MRHEMEALLSALSRKNDYTQLRCLYFVKEKG